MSSGDIAKSLASVKSAMERLVKAVSKNSEISDKQIDDLFRVIAGNAQASAAAAKSAVQMTRLQNADEQSLGELLNAVSSAETTRIDAGHQTPFINLPATGPIEPVEPSKETPQPKPQTVLEVVTPTTPTELSPEERAKLGEKIGGRLVSSARNRLEIPGEAPAPTTPHRDADAIDEMDFMDE